MLLALPACGIVFSSDFEGTEVFRELVLDGDALVDGKFAVDSPIAVTLTAKRAYPVPVAVSCRYEDVDITDDQRRLAFNERALSVFDTVLDANPGQQPGDDESVEDQVFRFEFAVTEPGDYFIACFTVAAPENGIGRGFTVIEE